MGTETDIYLGVYDFGDDPAVVSGIMGIEPTVAWVKGEHYSTASPNARRTHSRWVLSSGLDKTEPLGAHLDAILARLEPMRSEIEQVAQRYHVDIGVALYFKEVNPAFRLEAEVLRRLAHLGLPIDSDMYCLGQDDAS